MDKHVISRQNKNFFQSISISSYTIRYPVFTYTVNVNALKKQHYQTISSELTIKFRKLRGYRTDHLQEYMLVEVVALFTLGQCFVGLTELREGHPQNHDLVVVRCDLTLCLL